MSRARRILFLLLLALGAGGALLEHEVAERQRASLAARQARIAALEAEVRAAHRALARLQHELAVAEHDAAKVREELALAEAGSKLKVWSHRIALLKRLLMEMPGQSIPELRLLTPQDWVQVARTVELDTTENLRRALGGLRTLARQSFSTLLQAALKRYTEKSGGELPRDIMELARHLDPPADAAMLSGYTMTRTGKVGSSKEYVMKAHATSDFIMWVGLDAVSFEINRHWQAKENETDAERAERVRAGLASVITAFDGQAGREEAQKLTNLQELFSPWFQTLMHEHFARHYPAIVDRKRWEADIEDEVGAAVVRYLATPGAEPLTNMLQLQPYLDAQTAEKLGRSMQPVLAFHEYVHDRRQPPRKTEHLHRYLNQPFDAPAVLRAIKVNVEDGKFSGFGWF